MEISLAGLWLVIIGFFLMYYAVSDGFALGVGILCLFTGKEEDREVMMGSIHYIWHTSQTWLIIFGGLLFGAFPLFYSIFFSALYIPAVLMVLGLLLRGVSIDFHEHSRSNRFWRFCFGAGSLIAAIAQGLMLGGLLSGIHVKEARFAGGAWDWANPFSFTVCMGLIAGYVTLGCNYLVLKTEGDLQKRFTPYAVAFSSVTLILSFVVFLWAGLRYPHAARKWLSIPHIFYVGPVTLLAAVAFVMLFASLRRHKEGAPFFWNVVAFALGFVALSVSLYPQMIPHALSPLTIEEAAASPWTLRFMLVVTGILIPVMVFYTTYTYRVFRGKAGEGEV